MRARLDVASSHILDVVNKIAFRGNHKKLKCEKRQIYKIINCILSALFCGEENLFFVE